MEKRIKSQSTLNWYAGLNEIKILLNKEDCSSLQDQLRWQNIGSTWGKYLTEKKIVYTDKYGFYRWNDNNEVTFNLINDFRNYCNLQRQKKQKGINTIRKVFTKTDNKYYNCLIELKKELETKNILSISNFFIKRKVNQWFTTFLIKNNIIYKDENKFYRWNNKVELSIDMINKYREQYKFYYQKHNNERKINKIQSKQQTELNFDIPQTSLTSKPTYQKKMKDKVKKQREIIIQQHQQQVGVIRTLFKFIRKFLKWLW